MTTKTKLLLILPGFLLIVIFIYAIVVGRRVKEPPSSQQEPLPYSPAFVENLSPGAEPPSSPQPPSPIVPTPPPPPPDPQAQLKGELANFAGSFAERWGTLSNQDDISNAATLYPLMTFGMRTTAVEAAKGQALFATPRDIVHKIETRALNVHERSFDESKGGAVYVVITQRAETRGKEQRVFYQDVEVKLKREGAAWKVDGVEWGKEKDAP